MVVAPVPGSIDGLEHDVEQIVDVDEISPRVHHEAPLPSSEALVERREWSADVARTVGVGQAEREEFDPAQLDVLFAGSLTDGIAALRPDGVRKRDRLLQRPTTIAERRLEIEQAGDGFTLGRPHDIDRA